MVKNTIAFISNKQLLDQIVIGNVTPVSYLLVINFLDQIKMGYITTA